MDNRLTIPGTAPTMRAFAGWFLALFVVTQVPLYWVEYPDITDFPNHLARLQTLIQLPHSPALQRYYTLRKSEIGTNLAMEWIVPLLSNGMGIVLALKVFASLSILLLTSGAAALGRAVTGRFSYLLLGVLLFANNAIFQLGLLNYLFGVGLAFWLLAAWVCINARSRAGPACLAAFSFGCSLIYLCHLSAAGVYGIGVAGFQAASISNRPRHLKDFTGRDLLPLVQFMPVALLHSLVAANAAGSYVPASGPDAGLQAFIVYKAVLLLMAPLVSLSAYFTGQAVAGTVIVMALYIGFRQRALSLAMQVRWMAGSLAVAILFLPPSGFGSNLVDIRLIPACILLAWCGLEFTQNSRLLSHLTLAGIIASVCFLTTQTTCEWTARNGEYTRVRSALDEFPEGSRIATVMLDQGDAPLSISPHVGAWSVIDSSAFLSSFYIWPFQPFWVSYREPYAALAKLARTDDPGAAPPAYDTLRNVYDYVIVYGGDGRARTRYAPDAASILDTPSVRLLRTKQE